MRADEAAKPYIVQESLLDELCKEGLSREAAYRVVQLLSTSPKALDPPPRQRCTASAARLLGNPALDGVVMGVAFLVGALVPLLPYMLITVQRYDLVAALAATALFFGVGYFEGWLAHRNDRWRSGSAFLRSR